MDNKHSETNSKALSSRTTSKKTTSIRTSRYRTTNSRSTHIRIKSRGTTAAWKKQQYNKK